MTGVIWALALTVMVNGQPYMQLQPYSSREECQLAVMLVKRDPKIAAMHPRCVHRQDKWVE